MMKITRKATIAGLEKAGWVRDATARTTKYLVFCRAGSSSRFLVGKSGALRSMSQHDRLDRSISLSGNLWHQALCVLGEGPYRLSGAAEGVEVLDRIYHALRRDKYQAQQATSQVTSPPIPSRSSKLESSQRPGA
jgi:hypothetical protein